LKKTGDGKTTEARKSEGTSPKNGKEVQDRPLESRRESRRKVGRKKGWFVRNKTRGKKGWKKIT